jgi:hypothetical protein
LAESKLVTNPVREIVLVWAMFSLGPFAFEFSHHTAAFREELRLFWKTQIFPLQDYGLLFIHYGGQKLTLETGQKRAFLGEKVG